MRRSIGSASHARICSRRASSLSFLRASNIARRLGGRRAGLFFKRLFEDMQHRQILRTIRRPLTLQNICQRRDPQRRAQNIDCRGSIADAFVTAHSVDHRDEVQLKGIAIAHQPDEAGYRIERTKQGGLQVRTQGLELRTIRGILTNQEIEIDRGDRSPLQRRCGIPDENRLNPMLREKPGN